MYKKIKNKKRLPLKIIFSNVIRRKLKKIHRVSRVYFKGNELKFLVMSSLNKKMNIKKYSTNNSNLFYKNVKLRLNILKVLNFKYNINFLNNSNKVSYFNYKYSNNLYGYLLNYSQLLKFFLESKNKLNNKC
jgi:hypothetical protein